MTFLNRENLHKWRKSHWNEQVKTRNLYYLTPIKNLYSVLELGILSRSEVEKLLIENDDFSISNIQAMRANKTVELSDKTKRKLHELVPLFFNKNNATIKTRAKRLEDNKLCILEIDYQVILDEEIDTELAISIGNASTSENFVRNLSHFENEIKIDIKNIIEDDIDDYRRYKNERMSELLIYPKIRKEFIKKIFVSNKKNLPGDVKLNKEIIEDFSLFT